MSTSNNNDDFWQSLQDSISLNENNNNNMDANLPSTFLDTLATSANPTDFKKLVEQLLRITQSQDQSKIIPFLQQYNLTLLTIATGFTKEAALLHHLFETDQAAYALSGLNSTANTLSLIGTRLFNKTSTSVPTIETLCNPDKISQILNASYDDTDLHSTEVSNSMVLPPKLAHALGQQDFTALDDITAFVKDFVLEEDARLKREWQASLPLDEHGSRDLANLPHWENAGIKQYAPLLQALYYWNSLQSPRSAAFRLSNDPIAFNYLKALSEQFQPTTLSESTQAQNALPDGPNPFSEQQLPPRPATTTTLGSITTSLSSEQKNACTALGLDPTTYALMSAMQSQSGPQNHESNPDQAMSMAFNNLAESLDKFSDATNGAISDKSKLPKVLVQSILNAMTTDGENPADELTPTMKDLMQGSAENTAALLQVIIKKGNASAKPTPRFIRSAKKGKWTHEPGDPDNCSIYGLPQTLVGTPYENIDYDTLKEEELLGRNMTDEERSALYKNVIIPSRTMNYLLMKTKAWLEIIKECFGQDSLMAQEAENWVTFLSENLPHLMARHASFDRDLPARFESFISEQFSEYNDKAKYGVPPSYILDANGQRQALLRGHIKPELSKSVQEALRPTPKDDRKRKPEDGPHPLPNKRKNSLLDQVHNNQSEEIQDD